MKAGPKELKKDQILFREGDASDSAFVIKSGRLAITKAKGSSEIILAEIGPGAMLGEMAFFDSKPRSAGAKALAPTVVISLPFVALNAQFKTFPEWLKVMVKTINGNLREANKRIKNLESAQSDDDRVFDPYSITRLTAILTLVASQYGEKDDDGGVNVPSGLLRCYTIQIFQQPTNKMVKLNLVLAEMGHVKVEDLGEGRQKITVINLKLLSNFVNFYNTYLFKEESKRVTIEENLLPALRALKFYGDQAGDDAKNDDGSTKVSLTQVQNCSMKDLGDVVKLEAMDPLIQKGLCGEKMSVDDGVIVSVKLDEISPLISYWELIYKLLNFRSS